MKKEYKCNCGKKEYLRCCDFGCKCCICKKCFESLNEHPHVSDVRQKGMVLAIELVKNKKKKIAYDWRERRGIKAYLHGLKNNVLMRPLGNVLYFMPPYVITKKEISFVSEIMKEGVDEATKKSS